MVRAKVQVLRIRQVRLNYEGICFVWCYGKQKSNFEKPVKSSSIITRHDTTGTSKSMMFLILLLCVPRHRSKLFMYNIETFYYKIDLLEP